MFRKKKTIEEPEEEFVHLDKRACIHISSPELDTEMAKLGRVLAEEYEPERQRKAREASIREERRKISKLFGYAFILLIVGGFALAFLVAGIFVIVGFDSKSLFAVRLLAGLGGAAGGLILGGKLESETAQQYSTITSSSRGDTNKLTVNRCVFYRVAGTGRTRRYYRKLAK
jgi:hypothetical protein